jgi:lysozyme
LAGIIASVLVPLLGLHYSNAQKQKEMNKGFLELGIKILSDAPSAKNRPLRKWAVALVNSNSSIKLPDDAEKVLLDDLPLVSHEYHGLSKAALANLESEGLTLGVSVSRFNGELDYEILKGRGIRFAYIKLTEGTAIRNTMAERHAEQFGRRGIAVGFYHFLHLTRDSSQEVANFVSALQATTWQLPPAIDCERWNSSIANYADLVYEFATIVENKTGIRPAIYVTTKFANEHLDSRFAKFPLFIARYVEDDSPGEPELPNFWHEYMFWHLAHDSEDSVFHGLDVAAYRGPKAISDFRGNPP